MFTGMPAGRWRLAALSILAMLLLGPSALGAPTTAEQARRAVRGWLQLDSRPLEANLGSRILRVETHADAQGRPAWHIVYLEPAGYVIVSADDLVEPIVGFVSRGTFNASQDSPLGALVSRDLARRVDAARRQGSPPGRSARQAKWGQLAAIADGTAYITGIATISDIRVSPFVQSRWSQQTEYGQYCYNYYTPNHYPSGCVATAMAQVMRYHQHPAAGIGEHTFTITIDGASQSATTRGGDGFGGVYNWSLMMLDPNATITAEQREAIGALCYDAGIAVNMNYASGSSGGYNLGMAALKATFGYANTIRGYNNGSDIPLASLEAMVNPNLDAGLPVVLGISGTAGAHSVVCDGYGYNASTAYHHLNMGWGGSQDAWYNLPTVDSTAYLFTTIFECGYNIYPEGTGEIISGRVLDPYGAPVAGVTVEAQRSAGGTYTAVTSDRGVYGLAKVPSNSTYTVRVLDGGYVFPSQAVTTGTSVNLGSTTGNRWGIDLAGQWPEPPTADDVSAAAIAGRAIAINLVGSDDGVPNPPGALVYIVTSLPGHGQLADPDGGTIESVPYTLPAGGQIVTYTPAATYSGVDQFTYVVSDGGAAPGGGESNVATVSVEVLQVAYAADMDADPGWTLEDGWAWGQPTGGGSGSGDPTGGCTGVNVVGYNLGGDYENRIATIRYATAGPIDCSGYHGVRLRFQRWLGMRASPSDRASIQASGDGVNWTTLWSNGTSNLADAEWQPVEYDISAVADDQSAVYLRWGLGPTSNTGTYPGWNIDDVEVVGLTTVPAMPADPNPADGASSVPTDATLSWGGGTAEPLVTYNVHFDTANPPVQQVATGLSTASYAPGTLQRGQTYYWRVVAVRGSVQTAGPVWSLQTAPAKAGDIDGDGEVNIFDVFVIAECWGSQAGDPLYHPAADLDGDGAINIFDVFVLAENWNT